MANNGDDERTADLRLTEVGGLFVPNSFPTIDCADLCEKGYAERAEVILGAFFGLKVKCDDAYARFDDDPATIVKLDDNLFVTELWHGGTRSAADIPSCALPGLVLGAKAACDSSGLTDGCLDNNYDVLSCVKSDLATPAALTVCFFSTYCDLINNGEIKCGDKVDFVSPASSFEFVLAGWYARRMGLPVNRLLCSCTTDGALYDFIDTGMFDTQRVIDRDAVLENNIVRFVFDVSGCNAELTRERKSGLNGTGRFSVTPDEIERIRDVIAADYVDGDTAAKAIADLFDEYGYVADSQTAAAYAVAAEREFVRPTVVLSAKDPFLSAVEFMRAVGEKNVPPDKLIDRMEELTAMECAEYVRIRNSEL